MVSRYGNFWAMPLVLEFSLSWLGKTCTLIYECCFIFGIIVFTDANRILSNCALSSWSLECKMQFSIQNKNTNTQLQRFEYLALIRPINSGKSYENGTLSTSPRSASHSSFDCILIKFINCTKLIRSCQV